MAKQEPSGFLSIMVDQGGCIFLKQKGIPTQFYPGLGKDYVTAHVSENSVGILEVDLLKTKRSAMGNE